MSTDTEAPIYQKSVLEFKSSSFSVPVLVISCSELKQIEHQLDEKILQAPDFFKNSPILVDIQACQNLEHTIDIKALINCLHLKKLIPIGLSGGSKEQHSVALGLFIPNHSIRNINPIENTSSKKISTTSSEDSAVEATPPATLKNMLITQPIRSGQRVYAKGDLTVLSHVSAGAEVMAEGNIHVYGALRGRALAGVQGNIDSRIFCSDLQAELVSIAGHYKVSEELEKTKQGQPTQIYLKEQALLIKNL